MFAQERREEMAVGSCRTVWRECVNSWDRPCRPRGSSPGGPLSWGRAPTGVRGRVTSHQGAGLTQGQVLGSGLPALSALGPRLTEWTPPPSSQPGVSGPCSLLRVSARSEREAVTVRVSPVSFLFSSKWIISFTLRTTHSITSYSMKPDTGFSSSLNSPYGNDVGEEEKKAEETAVPGACKSLQGHHDNREGNQGQK